MDDCKHKIDNYVVIKQYRGTRLGLILVLWWQLLFMKATAIGSYEIR